MTRHETARFVFVTPAATPLIGLGGRPAAVIPVFGPVLVVVLAALVFSLFALGMACFVPPVFFCVSVNLLLFATFYRVARFGNLARGHKKKLGTTTRCGRET